MLVVVQMTDERYYHVDDGQLSAFVRELGWCHVSAKRSEETFNFLYVEIDVDATEAQSCQEAGHCLQLKLETLSVF